MKDIRDSSYYKAHKKVRKTWEISPVERVVDSKKEYDRQEAKRQLKEVIYNDEEDYDFDVEWYNDIY